MIPGTSRASEKGDGRKGDKDFWWIFDWYFFEDLWTSLGFFRISGLPHPGQEVDFSVNPSAPC